MTNGSKSLPGPSWRRVLFTLFLAFAIPAITGGIVGLAYAWRAQPLAAEAANLRERYERLHHRYDKIGNLDKLVALVLSRKQAAEELRRQPPNAESIRNLLMALPREVQLQSLEQANVPNHNGKVWGTTPSLAMTLRILEPPAAAEVLVLLGYLGFTDARIESTDKRDPSKLTAEFSAALPTGGKAESAP